MSASHRMTHEVKGLKKGEHLIYSRLIGAGAAALTIDEPFDMGSIVKSISRTFEGIYAVTFQEKFPQTVKVLEPCLVSATTTLGRKARWTALDLNAGTGTLRVETESGSAIPAWSGATTVSSNTTGALPAAGMITAVELVAGTVTGAGNLRDSAAANSRDVQVVYSAAGVPTLNFLAGDAVTSCKFQQLLHHVVDDAESTDTVYIGFVVRNVGTKAD